MSQLAPPKSHNIPAKVDISMLLSDDDSDDEGEDNSGGAGGGGGMSLNQEACPCTHVPPLPVHRRAVYAQAGRAFGVGSLHPLVARPLLSHSIWPPHPWCECVCWLSVPC